MRRLRDLLQFSRPETPDLEIAKDAFLAVLASRQPLPCLADVVSPKGEGGAVPGFGVPVAGGATDPSRPMERGVYGIASLNRKSVWKLRVLSKEEAGFVPDGQALAAIRQRFGGEVADRVAASWSLLQLTWESYDPDVYPAIDQWLALARRIAYLTAGVVADPAATTYRLPDDRAGRPAGARVWAPELVGTEARPAPAGLHVHSCGMRKFSRPELEATAVPQDRAALAAAVLAGIAQACLEGARPSPGDLLDAGGCKVRIAEGGLDRDYWQGAFVLEAIPEDAGGWSNCHS